MTKNAINIPAIRKALNLTQTQLAELAGVNLSTVWRWENSGVPNRGAARAFLDKLNEDAQVAQNTAASVNPHGEFANVIGSVTT